MNMFDVRHAAVKLDMEAFRRMNPECNAPLSGFPVSIQRFVGSPNAVVGDGALSSALEAHPVRGRLYAHKKASLAHERAVQTRNRKIQCVVEFQKATKQRVASVIHEKRLKDERKRSDLEKNLRLYLADRRAYMDSYIREQAVQLKSGTKTPLQSEEEKINMEFTRARESLLKFAEPTSVPHVDRTSDPLRSNVHSNAASSSKRAAPFWDRGLSDALNVRETANLVYRMRALEGDMERERARALSHFQCGKSKDPASPSPSPTKEKVLDQFATLTVEKVLSCDAPTANERADAYARRVQSDNRAHLMKQKGAFHDGLATTRYKVALRRGYVERLRENGIEVPPLCPCGRSIYDANIEMCANNCTFYKNRKAYEKAALSMILSMQPH